MSQKEKDNVKAWVATKKVYKDKAINKNMVSTSEKAK